MVMTAPRPCGEWPSPVGTDTVAAAGLKLGQTALTADGAAPSHLISSLLVPQEQTRYVARNALIRSRACSSEGGI